MAKTQSDCDKVFEYSWTGSRSGYSYKLQMIPSYETALSGSYETVTLPEGCIYELRHSWEYEGNYTGTPKMPVLGFKVDLAQLDGGTDSHNFNIFSKLIYNATSDITFTHTIGSQNIDISFTAGNLWILYVDTAGGSNYIVYFAGMQKEPKEEKLDMINKTIEIEVEDLAKSILSSISTEYIFYFIHYITVGTSDIQTSYVDFYHDYGTYDISTQIYHNEGESGDDRMWFHFAKLDDFSDFMDSLLLAVFDVVNRNISSAKTALYLDLGTYYKQLYDRSGNRGDALGYDEIYFIAYVTKSQVLSHNELVAPGNYSNWVISDSGLLMNIMENYNTIWDFIFDLTRQTGKTFWSSYGVNGSFQLDEINFTNYDLFSIFEHEIDSADLFGYNPINRSEKLTKVECSMVEKPNDNDIEKVTLPPDDAIIKSYIRDVFNDFYTPGTRTGNKMEFSCILHNNLNNVLWDVDNVAEYTRGNYLKVRLGYENLILYKDTLANGSVKYIRVHERCKINFTGVDSDTLVPNYFVNTDEAYTTKDQTYLQNLNCLSYIVSVSYWKLFNHTGQNKVEDAECFIETGEYSTNGIIWLDPNARMITVNLPTERPINIMAGELKNKYKLTKCEVTLIDGTDSKNDEIVKFDMLSTYV